MPRDASGVYSKPANTTAVSGATISSTDYNSLADDIASEITGSLPVSGSAPMTGQLKATAGTAGAPGLTFSGDADTGLYSSASNKVGVSAGGTKVAEFDSTGLVEGAWTDVASAATVDLGAQTTKNVRVTGTTTITSFGTVASGVYRRVRFAAALTLTHNSTSLILPGGASITTAAGDTLEAVSLGTGNWVVVQYTKASGLPPKFRGIVQIVNSTDGAVATGTTTIPADDTIPQITEGTQFLSVSITPTSATNKLIIDVVMNLSNSAAAGSMVAALFQDTTADALAVASQEWGTAAARMSISFRYYMTAGTTSATTFKVRAGSGAAGTTTFNGGTGSRLYGGTFASSITVTEFQP